ncbi:MAG: S-layer homology domain-containing protein [Clostridiales bacterium]|nr:S-layer homology domain-containing protein [Clostridiales bacterium]
MRKHRIIKNRRRAAAVMLAAAMLVSLAAPFIAFSDVMVQTNGTVQAASVTVPEQMKLDYVEMAGFFQGLEGKSGNATVKRGEFAKLLKLASSEKSKKMSKVKTALYKDVSKKNRYAPYIRLAVEKGWMTGYVNGTFRPGSAVTYRDAAKACVVLLGYQNKADGTKRSGNALMEQFYDMEISNVLDVSEGHKMTKKELALLFYGVLESKNAAGTIYGQSIGLSVDEDGKLDFGAQLIKKGTGPVLLASDWKKQVPFSIPAGHLFRNEKSALESQVKEYDVLYYLAGTSSVYVYQRKVTGTLDQVIRSKDRTPKSVVVSGETYVLGTSQAKGFFAEDGTIAQNDEVTLLLGADGTIAFALEEQYIDKEVMGVISQITTKMSNSVNDSYVLCQDMAVVDTKGGIHHFLYDHNDQNYHAGDAVKVSVTDGETTIEKLPTNKGLLGQKIWQDEKQQIGDYTLDSGLRIYDITDGVVTRIYSSELDQVRFPSDGVLYYEEQNQRITALMVKGMTDGDKGVYGMVNHIKVKDITYLDDGEPLFTYEVTLMINGKEETSVYSSEEISGSYGNGTPSKITTKEGETRFYQLASVDVKGFSGKTILTAQGKRYYDDSVTVYYQTKNKVSYPITYAKCKSLPADKIKAYYVNEPGMAKKICMLVAYE